MGLSHEAKETIRTVDSLASIVIQLTQIAITGFGLWWMMHHPH